MNRRLTQIILISQMNRRLTLIKLISQIKMSAYVYWLYYSRPNLRNQNNLRQSAIHLRNQFNQRQSAIYVS